MPHREVEDREDGVANELVHDPVLLPNGGGTMLVELAQQAGHPRRVESLGQVSVASDVREQHSGGHQHLLRALDLLELALTHRAQVRVHSTDTNTGHAERKGKWA